QVSSAGDGGTWNLEPETWNLRARAASKRAVTEVPMKRRMTLAVFTAYALMYLTGTALACKIIINDMRLPEGQFNPVNINHKAFKVDVKVRDPMADVTVHPTFHNSNPYPVEGTY